MRDEERVAVVTGANKGIGYFVCRDLARLGMKVVLTARDEGRGKEAVERLGDDEGVGVDFHPLDVTDPNDVEALASYLTHRYGRLDALVNNAGVFLDHDWASAYKNREPRDLHDHQEILRRTVAVNLEGAYLTTEGLAPLMKRNGYGRIVNVTSLLGQLSTMGGGMRTYRISKAALNAATRIFAAELAPSGVLVNAACPGWRRTDMGGPTAPTGPEEGADTIVYLATLPTGGPTGRFFRDRKEVAW